VLNCNKNTLKGIDVVNKYYLVKKVPEFYDMPSYSTRQEDDCE
jgi:hypothetical protein